MATDDLLGVGRYVLTVRTSLTLKSVKYNKTDNVCATYPVAFMQPMLQWKKKHYTF